jgi:hypothetical protein
MSFHHTNNIFYFCVEGVTTQVCFRAAGGLLLPSLLGSLLGVACCLFKKIPLCVLHQFKMPFCPPCFLAFTFQVAFQSMSKVPTFMPASLPKLARLFYIRRCLLLLCYIFVLSPLFFGLVLSLI